MSIKLTEAQKKVVRDMREGKKLYWSVAYNSHRLSGVISKYISEKTVQKLTDLKLIDHYTLTELGRNMEL